MDASFVTVGIGFAMLKAEARDTMILRSLDCHRSFIEITPT
jgi:hypothetical protein